MGCRKLCSMGRALLHDWLWFSKSTREGGSLELNYKWSHDGSYSCCKKWVNLEGVNGKQIAQICLIQKTNSDVAVVHWTESWKLNLLYHQNYSVLQGISKTIKCLDISMDMGLPGMSLECHKNFLQLLWAKQFNCSETLCSSLTCQVNKWELKRWLMSLFIGHQIPPENLPFFCRLF